MGWDKTGRMVGHFNSLHAYWILDHTLTHLQHI